MDEEGYGRAATGSKYKRCQRVTRTFPYQTRVSIFPPNRGARECQHHHRHHQKQFTVLRPSTQNACAHTTKRKTHTRPLRCSLQGQRQTKPRTVSIKYLRLSPPILFRAAVTRHPIGGSPVEAARVHRRNSAPMPGERTLHPPTIEHTQDTNSYSRRQHSPLCRGIIEVRRRQNAPAIPKGMGLRTNTSVRNASLAPGKKFTNSYC